MKQYAPITTNLDFVHYLLICGLDRIGRIEGFWGMFPLSRVDILRTSLGGGSEVRLREEYPDEKGKGAEINWPLVRSAAATGRRPWASRVPTNKVISFLQAGAVDSGRKTAKTSIMRSGRGMNILPSEIVLWSASILPREDFMPTCSSKIVQNQVYMF